MLTLLHQSVVIPDLTLHRAIKYLIAKQEGQVIQDRWTPTGGYHYSFDDIDVLGEQCSMTERRADDATRDVADWLKCEYMQDHLGDEFDGVIANVTGFGFFVRLNELNIDGLVHISNLANDYYQYDAIGQRLIGDSSGQVYRLGDTVKVKVASINLNDRQIDFDIVGSTRKQRGAGKTAKNREKQQRMRKAEGLQRQSMKVYRVEDGEAQQEHRSKSKKERSSIRPEIKGRRDSAFRGR